MKSIAIIGSGALGLYYGTRLGLTGLDVRFLLRADLEAVRARGSIIVHLKDRTLELKPAAVFGTTAEIGPVDLVIVTTKTTSNPDLPALIAPLLGPDTAILTLQNGLGSDQLLADHFGPLRILGGLAFLGVNRTGPGIVTCIQDAELILGEFGRPISERLRLIVSFFAQAGIKTKAVDSLAEVQWIKLVWNVPFNGLSITAGGVTTDKITGNPALAEEAQGLMKEVQTAAAALGHIIPDEYLKTRYEGTVRMPPFKPSSLVDYLGGRPVEVEAIWGKPLRQAEAAGVDCPRWRRLYTELLRLLSKKE